jgi:uncharacterized membrane protein SpoIIM required for sporulation
VENFTLVSALLGGLLIGIAAFILLLFNGRIMGVNCFNPGNKLKNIRISVMTTPTQM